MKRIKTFLFAVIAMMGTTGILTSCQEDAPAINYTMNITVTNDFSKVVEAIQNGFLKNEEAVKKLTESIDKMNTDQAGKLQSILDVLSNVNMTLDTKLAAIEAAMQAQTLSMEGKLDLLKAAIEALPDYSSKLDAIKTAIEALPDNSNKIDALVAAIEALPDYSDKFDAVVAALDAMKAQVEALSGSQEAIAGKIADVTDAINDLIAEVNSGNSDATQALAAIVAMLEELKAAIESGGGSNPVFTNTVTLDGVTMPVLSAGIDKSDLEEDNCYDIYLFLSEDKTKYINIMADGEHHNGKTLDLTRKEDEHNGWYWAVEMRNPTRLFQTFGEPGTEYPVFLSGTLQVDRIGTGTEFEITLKNGKVKGEGRYGDGLEHTISLNFKGNLEFDEF